MKYPKRCQYQHAKSQYRVRNWPEYEDGLQKRGDLTVWLSDAALDAWRETPSGKPTTVAPECLRNTAGLRHRSASRSLISLTVCSVELDQDGSKMGPRKSGMVPVSADRMPG